MKIKKIDTFKLNIPFEDFGLGTGMTPTKWDSLDFVLVRIEDELGNIGWGEAFSYFCANSVEAAINDLVVPLLLEQVVEDPIATNEWLQKKLSLFGRYGITMFAISGADIAVWDLFAKRQQKSLAECIAQPLHRQLPAYASLVRYGDAELAANIAQRAVASGFKHVKLHEIEYPEIETVYQRVGPEIELMVDVNNNWSFEQSQIMIDKLKALGISWLEEPTFPPEDFEQMAKLRGQGVSISAGENFCTAQQFKHALTAGSLDIVQPSVTKVGGISEFLKALKLFQHPVRVMPHSPYFGPGYLATLQIMSTLSEPGIFEYLYVKPEDFLFEAIPLPINGQITVPQGYGLGMDPDMDVIERYRKY
jgi:L-alanine-DL-glutamate epimerase-like enolase superfamily enzyme